MAVKVRQFSGGVGSGQKEEYFTFTVSGAPGFYAPRYGMTKSFRR